MKKKARVIIARKKSEATESIDFLKGLRRESQEYVTGEEIVNDNHFSRALAMKTIVDNLFDLPDVGDASDRNKLPQDVFDAYVENGKFIHNVMTCIHEEINAEDEISEDNDNVIGPDLNELVSDEEGTDENVSYDEDKCCERCGHNKVCHLYLFNDRCTSDFKCCDECRSKTCDEFLCEYEGPCCDDCICPSCKNYGEKEECISECETCTGTMLDCDQHIDIADENNYRKMSDQMFEDIRHLLGIFAGAKQDIDISTGKVTITTNTSRLTEIEDMMGYYDVEYPMRDEDTITTACHEIYDRVWYIRNYNKTKSEADLINEKHIASKFGGHDEVYTPEDFEFGMLLGKLSALRWVLGDEWDNLETH